MPPVMKAICVSLLMSNSYGKVLYGFVVVCANIDVYKRQIISYPYFSQIFHIVYVQSLYRIPCKQRISRSIYLSLIHIFTEFDMLKKYRQSFATSELGRLHALFPFSELARQMHLKSSALGQMCIRDSSCTS